MHVALVTLAGRCQQTDGADENRPHPARTSPTRRAGRGGVTKQKQNLPHHRAGFSTGWARLGRPPSGPSFSPRVEKSLRKLFSCPICHQAFPSHSTNGGPSLLGPVACFWPPSSPCTAEWPPEVGGGTLRLRSWPSPMHLQPQLCPRTPRVPAAARTALPGFLRS